LLFRPWPRDKGRAAKARGTENTKIEVIATPEVAQKIFEHVVLHYFDNYALIAFFDDVEVLRGDKFGATILHEQ
jgi:nitrogen regulatory protein P-II 2